MARVALMMMMNGASQAAVLPDAFLGTWNPINDDPMPAILGLVNTPTFTMAHNKKNGDYWMSVLTGQVFRVREDVMQYCFAHVATSPFVVDTVEDNLIRFCYKTGDRMSSHKMMEDGTPATGCDAAKIELEMHDNGHLEVSFYMSPPVRHAWAVYNRTGDPPSIASYIAANLGGKCDPLNPGPPTAAQLEGSPCPHVNHKRQQLKPALPTVADEDGLVCRQYNAGGLSPGLGTMDMRLQYTVPEESCWPCNVSYSLSGAVAEDEYIAIGFKGVGYRKALPTFIWNVSRPNYFGMSADEFDDERTGRAIVLGYAGGSSGSCVREMKAENYVGAPSDVEGNPHLFNETVERVNGRTIIRFTVEQHVGRDDTEISHFFNGEMISMRTMWAIGDVDGAGCDAKPQFHRARGLSPLSWFDMNPKCQADREEFGVRVELEAVSV